MKKFFKWLFFAPIIFFGVWLIALFWAEFRTALINAIKSELQEIERRYK